MTHSARATNSKAVMGLRSPAQDLESPREGAVSAGAKPSGRIRL
jgi:hypothetical protein